MKGSGVKGTVFCCSGLLFLYLTAFLITPAGAAHFYNEDTFTTCSEISLSTQAEVDCDPESEESERCEDSEIVEFDYLYTIEPDAGEQSGDCVVVTYTYEGEGAVSFGSVSGQTTAGAWLGGEGSPKTDPARIILHPDTDPEVKFTYGPESTSEHGAPINANASGTFTAHIGDKIGIEMGALSECYAKAPDTSQASSDASLAATLEPCAIPTLNQWGMILFGSLLAAAILWRMRKGNTKPAST